MKKVADFKHYTGFHCGSSAIRSMLNFHGHTISEPMALGIGQGLGIYYMENEKSTPSRLLMPRTSDLEMVSLCGFGYRPVENKTDDPDMGWRWVKGEIDAGRPAMLQVDLVDLPYYGTSTRFAGHKIIVFGYDESAGQVLVSDNEFEQPQIVSMEQLEKARTSPQPPFGLKRNWFEISPPENLLPYTRIIPAAIRGQAEKLYTMSDLFGVPALRFAITRLDEWSNASDWKWCARFLYQVIEKRGTGGGGFRLKYSQFLTEAAEHRPEIAKEGLDKMMADSAAAWTRLALYMKKISEQEKPIGISDAAPLMSEIADIETDFCETALKIFE